MRRSVHATAHPKEAATRILWLPGAYNSAEDFVRAGFGEAVDRRGLPLDLEFIDLELRYLGDGQALVQLHEDVVVPLQRAGIAVWLGGISLGGLLALHLTASRASEVAGLCLLAPYMGNRMLIEEIAQASSLQDWRPGQSLESDAERQVWHYIQNRGRDAAPLYLGFGRQDRFAAGLELLARSLPPESVNIIDGGHDWRTWTTLWEHFLDSHFA